MRKWTRCWGSSFGFGSFRLARSLASALKVAFTSGGSLDIVSSDEFRG